MPIAQILLASGASGSSAPPTPTYTLTPATTSTNEGSSLTLTVGGTNIPDGTYYWTIGSGSEDFVTTDGTVSVTSNSGSFTVTPTADSTTEGSEMFIVALREGSTSGTILASSGSITINDTSLTPVPPFSLDFVESQGDYLQVAGSSNFNLGTTWTIEFWLKANAASETAIGGIWGLVNQVGWSTTNAIVVALSDNKLVFLSVANNANDDVRYTEPTPGRWTHVAISNNAGTQKVFYNGSEQTIVSGNLGTASYTNGTDPVRIGRLGPQNGGTLDGKMALIRISNTAKYSATFTPTVTYGVEADTKLFLDSDTPLIGQSYYELNGIATSQGNGSTIYFSKTTYPNLNNQVQSGDTVVDASTSTSSTVTGAVYTADPDNWGIDISPSQPPGTKNFSGTRSAPVTNNGVTESTTFVNRYTALHSELNQGSSGIHIDTNPTNDAWAGSVPVGATIISQFTGRFTVAARGRDSNNNWFFSVDGSNNFTAGETHTFIW
jgi:hypothetical protein